MEQAGNSFVEIDLATVEDRRAAWILDYWTHLPRAGTLPSPKQIDPLDIPPNVLPHIFKISVVWTEDGKPSFVYRLSGTQLTKEYQREITGKTPRAAFPNHYEDLEAGYAIAAGRHRPTMHRYRRPILNREFRWVERLICPLANDGEKVDMLFGCLIFP